MCRRRQLGPRILIRLRCVCTYAACDAGRRHAACGFLRYSAMHQTLSARSHMSAASAVDGWEAHSNL